MNICKAASDRDFWQPHREHSDSSRCNRYRAHTVNHTTVIIIIIIRNNSIQSIYTVTIKSVTTASVVTVTHINRRAIKALYKHA